MGDNFQTWSVVSENKDLFRDIFSVFSEIYTKFWTIKTFFWSPDIKGQPTRPDIAVKIGLKMVDICVHSPQNA